MRPAVWAPAALVLGWTALWLATVPLGDFPLNDDWTYGLAVQSILQTGRLSLLPWSSANAFAQLYWGALFCRLFGFSYEVLRLSTAVLGAAGVLATYGLLRELRASAGVAALGALVVGCNPLYLSQSVTFMTDVPFAALTIVSFWLCARRLMAPAYGIGLLAVLIRQFAVVLPVAFAAAMLRRQRHSAGQWAALAGSVLAFLALHVGFQHWMVATHRTSGFEIPASALLHLDLAAAAQRVRSSAMPTLGALGMALLPFAAVLPRRIAGWAATLGLAGAMLTLLIWKHELPPLPGNVVTRFGIGPLTLTDTYDMKQHLPSLPGAEGFWLALSVGACWGLATGAVSIVRTARGRRRARPGSPAGRLHRRLRRGADRAGHHRAAVRPLPDPAARPHRGGHRSGQPRPWFGRAGARRGARRRDGRVLRRGDA